MIWIGLWNKLKMRRKEIGKMKYSKTNLEYFGLETLFQNIINANEAAIGVYGGYTKSIDITRRIPMGLEVFDGEYDVYIIGELAVAALRCYNGRYYLYGYDMRNREIENLGFDERPDVKVDISEFAESYHVDIDKLLLKIHRAVRKSKRA